MARAKTGSFWLRETVTIPAGAVSLTRVQGAVDLGAYIDVANSIAVAVEQVDWQIQGYDIATGQYHSFMNTMFLANCALSMQLTDLDPNAAIVRADNNSLVASASMQLDRPDNIVSHSTDFYPDTYGKLDESFTIVNNNMYVCAGVDGSNVNANQDVTITCSVKARLVKLEKADWVALAIQATAAV